MDSKPSVSIAELNGQTMIEICQVEQGVTNRISSSVQDFKHLMFILKSIDERLRQKTESKQNFFETIQPNDKNVFSQIETFPSAESKKSIDANNEYNPDPKHIKIETYDEYNPDPKHVKLDYSDMKTIRDELLEIYCEQFCEKIPSRLTMNCTGCLFGSDARKDHNVCKMMSRKEKIELVFDDVLNELDDSVMKQLLAEKRWNGSLPYNENLYIEKNVIIKNSNWIKKLKSRIDKFL